MFLEIRLKFRRNSIEETTPISRLAVILEKSHIDIQILIKPLSG